MKAAPPPPGILWHPIESHCVYLIPLYRLQSKATLTERKITTEH